MAVTVWITGAGRGIGRAIAVEVAHYYREMNIPVNIAMNSRTRAELRQTSALVKAQGASVLALVGDVSDPVDRWGMLDDIHQAFGPVDVLINNAGVSYIGLLQDMMPQEISYMLNVNLEAAIALASLVIPDLLQSENAPRIINISSVWGNVGASCEVAYSAAKGGMNAFTKALARELAPSRIPVNAIACGFVDTDMNNHLDEEEREALFQEIPAGRPASTEEIAQTVCLMLCATDYLTGQIITVDGGWT